jgi:hypothetical protein
MPTPELVLDFNFLAMVSIEIGNGWLDESKQALASWQHGTDCLPRVHCISAADFGFLSDR